ncbi:MAG: methionyl-tRNA formyltransferase [Alicyclobacillus mali]|uniref:methionyl-tRNA formyltransferase n=1 Tax=Alicyclobacillus mali (ex Roth et al. 2021) TaxID=1123961 RepID=UPI000832573C|nr:methionyl-tRNA formyltransferase [Alicyclobacillus mali (ex Roth et al. 2021)]MCL6488553.1 methionyl-tRNA formyltransferase [Alicyclobacillus mali (ex Roth et al. 2021)]
MTVRALFCGTPDFAVPSLDALCRLGYEVVVITQPDRPRGRSRTLAPPPVKVRALELGLPVWQPERLRDAMEDIRRFAPDLIVTAAYGKILSEALLRLPRVGSVNVHASLLPRWRGAAPIQRAIWAGDAETGITLMEMVRDLDAGPILAQERAVIEPTDTAGSLHDKLARLGGEVCERYLPLYVAGELVPVPQPAEGVTYAEKLAREDEWIDWTRSAAEIDRQVRALAPVPGASAALSTGDEMKVLAGRPMDMGPFGDPGEVKPRGDALWVSCGAGIYEIFELKPSGRRAMPAGAFWRGLRGEGVRMRGNASDDR